MLKRTIEAEAVVAQAEGLVLMGSIISKISSIQELSSMSVI